MKYLLIITIILITFTSCSTKTSHSEFDFANIMAKNELWKEARMRWEKLIPVMPRSAKLHNNLAIVYEMMGEFKKAEKEYKTALKLSPNNSYIKSNYERFNKKGEKNVKKKNNK